MEQTERKKDDFSGQRMVVLPEKVINYLSDNEITKILYATDIGYFPNAKGHFRQRATGSMQNILIYCIDGSGWVSINGMRSAIKQDQYCFIPFGTPHTYAASVNEPWTIYWVHFSGKHASRFLQFKDKPVKDSFLSGPRKETRIRLFDEIFSNLSSEYTEHNLEYAGIVLQYFLASFSHESSFASGEESRYEDIASRAINYMRNHLSRKVTLEEISGHCGLSVSHFCLLFRRRTSYTPVEYLNHLRIQQACSYLDLTKLNISEISERLGFSDPFYFSRVFRKSIGQSPKEYRRNKSG